MSEHVCDLPTLSYDYTAQGRLYRIICSCGRIWHLRLVPDNREPKTGVTKLVEFWNMTPRTLFKPGFQDNVGWSRALDMPIGYYDDDWGQKRHVKVLSDLPPERNVEAQETWREFKMDGGFAKWKR